WSVTGVQTCALPISVIGSGSGGSEAAFLAAEKGFRAILIEKDAFGGTRFHRGCFAVRALHASSRAYLQIAKSRKFGIQSEVLRKIGRASCRESGVGE